MKKFGILDHIPAPVRHAVIALAGALIAWGAESLNHAHLNPALASLVGAGVTSATLILTPLTQQYGIQESPVVPVQSPIK